MELNRLTWRQLCGYGFRQVLCWAHDLLDTDDLKDGSSSCWP